MKQPLADELIRILQGYPDTDGAQTPHDLLEKLRSKDDEEFALGQQEGVEMVPEPGFVVKTTDSGGCKVFINVCASDKVPPPGDWTSGQVPEDVQEALRRAADGSSAEMDESLRFPLSVSDARQEKDHHGAPCTTYDFVLNSDVIQSARLHRGLKSFLIQLALGWISDKYSMALDPHYKLPKMRYKGDKPHRQYIRREAKPLITELGDDKTPVSASTPKPAAVAQGPASLAAQNPQQPGLPAKTTDGARSAALLSQEGGALPNADCTGLRQASLQPQADVVFQGRPVHTVQVMLSAQPLGMTFESGPVHLELLDERLRITAPGCAPTEVRLPFAVSLEPGEGAEASLAPDMRACTLLLPFKACSDCMQQACQYGGKLDALVEQHAC